MIYNLKLFSDLGMITGKKTCQLHKTKSQYTLLFINSILVQNILWIHDIFLAFIYLAVIIEVIFYIVSKKVSSNKNYKHISLSTIFMNKTIVLNI